MVERLFRIPRWIWRLAVCGSAVSAWGQIELPLPDKPLPVTLQAQKRVLPLLDQSHSAGQAVTSAPVSSKSPAPEFRLPRNILRDQLAIWSSPMKLRPRDAAWLVPASGMSVLMFRTDADAVRHFNVNDSSAKRSRQFSDAGVLAMGATAGAIYLVGRWKDDPHARETGILSAEALADALAVVYPLKYSLRRERPFALGSQGDFFKKGGESFPSTHATAAWALAAVIANEYPGWLTRAGVYGLAAAVSVARVSGKQHFPSDVVIGSALGWGIGTFVYRKRHDASLPGTYVGSGDLDRGSESDRAGSSPGTTYVPLDHWSYAAMDRLAALGALDSDFAGLRPWTRIECARLVIEAGNLMADADPGGDGEATRLHDALRKEFSPEIDSIQGARNDQVVLDAAYLRLRGIAGPPLTDGYHFGQTVTNDFGRPFGEGINVSAGIAGRATYGPLGFYLQSEFQSAPEVPAPPPAARQWIADIDKTLLRPGIPKAAIARLRLLDTYISWNASDWQFTLGQQSLWWGPGRSGSMMFSDNAEPILMLRISRATPMEIPGFSRIFGPVRTEFFFGQLSGHQFIYVTSRDFSAPLSRQPLLHGFKFSLKPTPNFEFGVAVTTIFAGPGVPFTGRTFLRSFGFSNAMPGEVNDPGDRRSGFDLRYRLPGLRKAVTFYLDSFTEDEISPLGFPRRSAFNLGLFFPRLPWTKRVDLRAEGFYTDLPGLTHVGFYYSNFHYRSGYTNQGNLLGHWIGRQGSGFQLQSTYWLTPTETVRLSYRAAGVSSEFVPGGGDWKDVRLQLEKDLSPSWRLAADFQFERWRFPILAATPQANVTSTIQVQWRPAKVWRIR